MILRSLVLAIALLFTVTASAQIHVSAGASLGSQPYRSARDDRRAILSGDVLVWARSGLGAAAAVDYASTSEGGVAAFHTDLIYRHTFGRYALLVGAGPTFVRSKVGSKTVWNGDLEGSRTWGRMELLVRVRQYAYRIDGNRYTLGSRGPAVFLGGRFNLR